MEAHSYLDEVLLRFGPAGFRGAHQRRATRYVADNVVVTEKLGDAEPLSPDALAGIIGAEAAGFVADAAALAARVEELDAVVAALEAKVADFEAAEAARQARTPEQYAAAIQVHLDATVRERGYESILSCVSYRHSSVALWAAEAAAAIRWRDAVWAYAYALLASPPDPLPTPAELIAAPEFPVIEWPA